MNELSKKVGAKLEHDYVKSTYENIASDFSTTRYKKWPKVEAFLKSLQPGSLVLDVGCGNGKYLDNPTTYNIGCDLSLNLLRICRSRGLEVVQCDMTKLPFRQDIFDTSICIAALHHVTTNQRRQDCIRDITQLLSKESRLLVQVWSYEQNLEKDNPYLRRYQDQETTEQKIEVGENIKLPIHKNRTPFLSQDVLVPFHTKAKDAKNSCAQDIRLRYYHVFKEGELEELLSGIPNIKRLDSYYDRGNWCTVVSRRE